MEELTGDGRGERKRWPVLINIRRDTPKSPIQQLTMEISTEQNPERNMGGVENPPSQSGQHFLTPFLLYSISF